ncbi:cytochrome C [Bifidobacterium dolichotidis]|uniref:Cytochrome C n=1 Tax=Bifidobacterium dolichotidis TaxID=2306976 RepID=A0A430FQ26_9BIFI|nr:acyl-CoA thioester hydrolase/BAAT C-terminal domain-containing protein [Bifidobacterium dolichotidis]RSX54930.1 cytochrome C [Bifidobacterium dolichotidis]
MGTSQSKLKPIAWSLGVAIVLFAILGALSYVMAPRWSVHRLSGHITVTDADTAIQSKLGATTQEGTYEVRTTPLKLTISDGVQVNAILREPINAPQNHPAVEFVHGAGTGKASEVFGDIAHAMASSGITTLVQDKRLDNYTFRDRNYVAMADDYLDGVNYLRHTSGVNPAQVGLYAESEGTWISSVMASKDPSLAFAVLTSAPVVSPRQQMAMAATAYLHIAGAPKGVIGIVPKITSMNFGMLDLNYADFDAEHYLSAFKMPLLVNYGTKDPAMPVEQGAAMLIRTGRENGNTNVTVRYYPTNHQMRMGSMQAKPDLPLEPNYTHNLEDWVHAVANGTKTDDWQTPLVAGDKPFQEWAAPSTITPGLITSINVIIILSALEVLLCVLSLVFWIVGDIINVYRTRRIRRYEQLVASGTFHTASSSSDAQHASIPSARHRMHIPSLKRPLPVSKSTKVLVSSTMLLSIALTAGFIAYFVFALKTALNLQDQADEMHFWWHILQIGTALSVLVFSFMLIRIVGRKTTLRLPNHPKRHAIRLLREYWLTIGSVILCALIMLFLAAFFGLFVI